MLNGISISISISLSAMDKANIMDAQNHENEPQGRQKIKLLKDADKVYEEKIRQIVNGLVTGRQKADKQAEALNERVESLERQLNVANTMMDKYKLAMKKMTGAKVNLDLRNRDLQQRVRDLSAEVKHYVKTMKDSQENGIPLSQSQLGSFVDSAERSNFATRSKDSEVMVIDDEAGNGGANSPQY